MTAELIKPGSYPLDVRQVVKILVYSLLVVNFTLYIRDAWVIAEHTLRIIAVAIGEETTSENQGFGDCEFVPWQIGAQL
jgi:hypothetical protein